MHSQHSLEHRPMIVTKGKNIVLKRITLTLGILAALMLLTLAPAFAHGGETGMADNGLFFVDYRHLDGGADGVMLVNLDPTSPEFGTVVQTFELGMGVTPHHLYYNRDESRLYNTALGGEYLYELILERDKDGLPTITEAVAIDTGGSTVGEDMYFSEDGSRYWVTFVGGFGEETGGTVGAFDAETNALLETIVAPIPDDPASGEPFVMYPHGISANEELGYLMVTSASHAEFLGFGNTVTLIDMATNQPVETMLVSESWDDQPVTVEVLLLRDDFPTYALATAMLTGDIWLASYDETAFDDFSKAFDGSDNDLSFALELYIGPGDDIESDDDNLLYVSFGVPGVVNVYSLDSLPELPLVKSFPAEAGAHHLGFFKTEAGHEAMLVQNNLLNLNDPMPALNAGSLMIMDIHTGELLGRFDMPSEYGLIPESIESAAGNAHFYHH